MQNSKMQKIRNCINDETCSCLVAAFVFALLFWIAMAYLIITYD